jgi:hypothetical protein
MLSGWEWDVRYSESRHLTTIDGFLITYRQRCYITLRSSLSATQKAVVAKDLLKQLVATSGTGSIHLAVTRPESHTLEEHAGVPISLPRS